MLEVENLSCTRGDRVLFSGLFMTLEPGRLLHVTGRNGSGKTTLLRTLCGLTRPASGTVRWQGQPINALGEAYHAELAYVAHLNGIQGELTPVENLRLGDASHQSVSPELATQALDRLGLASCRGLPAKTLSEGQKRRLALARVLLNRKPLWILDEPFSALDVESCGIVTAMIRAHVQDGGLVAITSHIDLTLNSSRIIKVALGAQAPVSNGNETA